MHAISCDLADYERYGQVSILVHLPEKLLHEPWRLASNHDTDRALADAIACWMAHKHILHRLEGPFGVDYSETLTALEQCYLYHCMPSPAAA